MHVQQRQTATASCPNCMIKSIEDSVKIGAESQSHLLVNSMYFQASKNHIYPKIAYRTSIDYEYLTKKTQHREKTKPEV